MSKTDRGLETTPPRDPMPDATNPSDDLPHIMDRIRRGEYIEHYETARIAKDGKRVDVSVTISPISSPDGTVSGAAAIARDVTERRRLEAQFIESQKLESVGRLAGGCTVRFRRELPEQWNEIRDAVMIGYLFIVD